MQRPNQKEDVQITKDQFKKIQRAMKKPEFMGLLNDYMLEISDPKNRAEYDQYLKQLEKDKQLPKGTRLVRPTPQFCVKTTLISQSNKRHQMKIFLNFCSCSQLEKPNFQQTEKGQNWQLPHSVNKIRYDQDNQGNVCNTVDIAYHSQTIELCRMTSFQAMVIQAGIQGATKQLGERKQSLSLDYKIMRNLKCKGQQPALMLIRFSQQGRAINSNQSQGERGQQGKQTKLQRQINKQKQQLKKNQEPPKAQDQIQVFDDIQNQKIITTGVERPKFKLIFSYPVEYSDFIDQRIVPVKYPNQLNIDFQLPRVQSVQELIFEMNQTVLRLQAKQKYLLQLPVSQMKIKYSLIWQSAKSKFDKKKKKLRLIIPVDQSALPKPQPKQQFANEPLKQDQAIQSQQTKIEQPIVASPQDQQAIQQQKLWQNKNKLLEINEQITYRNIVKQEEEKVPLIQQIDADDNLPDSKTQKPIIEVKKEAKQITFKFQQTQQKATLVYSLPKYNKEFIKTLIHQNSVLLRQDFQEQTRFVHLSIPFQFNSEAVKVSYLKDFIVVNIAKNQKKYWEASSITRVKTTHEQFVKFWDNVYAINEEREKARIQKIQQLQLAKLREQQATREEFQRRQAQRHRAFQQMREKLMVKGSGKQYKVHFLDFCKVGLVWESD